MREPPLPSWPIYKSRQLIVSRLLISQSHAWMYFITHSCIMLNCKSPAVWRPMTRRQINPTGPRSSVPPLPLTASFSVSSTRGSDEENQDEEQEEEEEMVPGAAGDSLMTPCSRYTTALHTLSTHSVHTHTRRCQCGEPVPSHQQDSWW